MRKIFLIAVLAIPMMVNAAPGSKTSKAAPVASAPASSGAEDMRADKSDGCGPGWYVYDKKTILGTTVRATFNPSGSNTFGMSSGTSNCEQHSLVLNNKVQRHFTEKNYNTIVTEMALGQGQFLSEYAGVFGCEEKSFGDLMQQNFSKIVPVKQDAGVLIENVKKEIANLNCAV